MSLRGKEGGLLQKVILFINELQLGDKVSGLIYKLLRSSRYDGQISGALIKIGDRNSDIGFIPGRYIRQWLDEQDADPEQHKKRKAKSKPKAKDDDGLRVGDMILAEVVAVNPAVQSFEAELILKPIKVVPKKP